MIEPSRRTSRRTIASGVAAAIALAGVGFAVGRETGPRADGPAAEPAPAAIPAPAPAPATPLPLPSPPLGRGDLMAAVRAAVDAFASGSPFPPEVESLAGRRFEIRLAFGCGGPSPKEAPSGWHYDEAVGALRVRVTAAAFDPAAWLGASAAAAIDSSDGFWIERPWTRSETCPPVSPTPAAAVAGAPERTLGLVRFHGADESRVGRRDGEPYEAVEKVAPDSLNVAQGLRLRLAGRLVAAPGGATPIICRAPQAGTRPVCLIAVSLDQVAIENPATGATLATWDVASPEGGQAAAGTS